MTLRKSEPETAPPVLAEKRQLPSFPYLPFFNRWATPAPPTTPPLGDIVRIDGMRVHFTIEGEGPPLILIHGAGGNLRDFTFELTAKLKDRFTVICFDRPGHGYTDSMHLWGETPIDQAHFLKKAADHILDGPAIIAGYSLGGAVALAWALEFPADTSGILLMSPVTHRWHTPLSLLYHLGGHPVTSLAVSEILSRTASDKLVSDTLTSIFQPQQAPAGYLEYIGADLALQPTCLRANCRQVRRLKGEVTRMSRRYGELTMPIATIHGQKDRSVPSRAHSDMLALQLPHTHFQLVPDVGHSTQHHAHDEIIFALDHLVSAI